MPTRVRVVAYVPAAARDACEQLVAQFLVSPNDPGVYTFSAPLVPLGGADDATPTHYGCSVAVLDDGGLIAALPTLQASVSGSAYKVISPWRTFDFAADWTGWLAAGGLKVRQEVVTGEPLAP